MIPKIGVSGSNVKLCRIGFGCARLFGGSEARSSARMIEIALEAGIRHFDTAPSYGDGTSEGVVGSVLRGMKDVTITTKVGISAPSNIAGRQGRVAYRTFVRPLLARAPGLKSFLLKTIRRGSSQSTTESIVDRRTLPRDEIVRSIEMSLERLKRERVDLFLIHDPDQYELTAEMEESFEALVRENLVGAYGMAFDRKTLSEKPFGSILQSRAQLSACPDFRTKIYHGLLRRDRDDDRNIKHVLPEDVVSRFLLAVPDSIVIFSASSPHQVNNLMNKLKHRLEW